ncbi:uncharacterized protein A4U43_C05F21750 [Asparagus officinalis]|uniref:DYW domain-containing protein n=1 Tax=Asparagus officinalis TaxID=4686 RepID=A0A5P1EUT0_ASPOF|nr:pentatricopeptide repeat-containing protein At3g63370, chloroplastic [Asparagus officinalis]XP_020264328.1 pentatricopeptide repeat-containing protein At3g63370, chloroplastic [Asparagus officinalis]XP_020264329.1 pentatricopeptide repeat-containing protein At3g63370, chloroplastic [Asparagus officinalis]XP_020264330.1 pentatricopeptide repeat-containing protein At3g63370, chloroplastic [Asparagus officinalis]XP_020264331.1 pentatricopeptide repeat-containing protein At3g63370, chloroplastic
MRLLTVSHASVIPKSTPKLMVLSSHFHSHLHFPSPTTASSRNPPPQFSIPSRNPNTTSLSPREPLLPLTSSPHQSPSSCFSHLEAYSSLLELCASQKAIKQGQQIHAHILKSTSLSNDGFLPTKLLFMYGKCGHLFDAHDLFDDMRHRTVFCWNALVGSYSSHGQHSKAIELYMEMRGSGVMPDACTFASVLKACGGCEDLHLGSEIHSLAIKRGISATTFVVNALVAMYSKCGRFDLAVKLFEMAPDARDVVTWNSIISACVQDGKFYAALDFFREMGKSRVDMSSYTVVAVLQACTELLLVKLGMEIHASLLKLNRRFHIFESNALLVMYSRCGRMGDAIRVFDEMDEKDKVSWNSMLSGYVQNGLYVKAIEFFNEMLESGFEFDEVSIISLASGLGRLENLHSGKAIHGCAIKCGFDSELQVGNTLIDMYTKCGNVKYAELVFHKMPSKDYISWTTAIAGYARSSRHLEAFELFREVQRLGMEADPVMIGSILLACSSFGCLSLLKQIHGYAIRHGLLDLLLKNTIIDIYGDCRQVSYANRIFERLEDKDVVSWTSMINCYVDNALFNEALSLSLDMIKANIDPDAVALVSIIAAVSGMSSLIKGKEIHGFGIRRDLAMDGLMCNSLIDMYALCGRIDASFKIFNRLRTKDLVLWTTIIRACGLHGKGKEAIEIFNEMEDMGLVPDHVAFLALLYACSHSGLNHDGKVYFDKMINEYKLDPWPEHYACVVDVLGRSGRVVEAFKFIQSMPVEPTAAIWCSLLGACRVHSNHQLAEVAAENLLELEPENPGNYVLVSNVFAAMGKWEEVDTVRAMMEDKGLRKEPALSWIELGNKVHKFVARDNSHRDMEEIYSKLEEITKRLEREGGYVADTRFVLHHVEEDQKVKMLNGHSERLAIALGLIHTPDRTQIRIFKNLRVCGDCHEFTKFVSKFFEREIIVRDANRFHHFRDGCCSCGNFW